MVLVYWNKALRGEAISKMCYKIKISRVFLITITKKVIRHQSQRIASIHFFNINILIIWKFITMTTLHELSKKNIQITKSVDWWKITSIKSSFGDHLLESYVNSSWGLEDNHTHTSFMIELFKMIDNPNSYV